MEYYDKLNELAKSLKNTEEYKNYILLKNEIRKDEKIFDLLKKFKEDQKEQQLKVINGKDVSEEEKSKMQNLYSILIQNENVRKLLECEMKINVYLADMQKIMGESIKEIVEF